jgi:hypothetical protein
LVVVLASALALLAAGDAPVADKTRERPVPGAWEGIARFGDGWVFSGGNGLWRTDNDLRVERANARAIPANLRARGYHRIGDIDVAGVYLYAALEQSDSARKQQVFARFDAKTLAFVDSVTVAQHENPFVTVDVRSGTAYAMDRDRETLLRYDLGGLRWRRLPPVRLDRRIADARGADLEGGFAYLSTADRRNTLHRVDLASGAVVELGSAGHAGGDGRGIDVTPRAEGRIHTLTVDAGRDRALLGDFGVPAARRTGPAEKVIIAVTVAATLVATVVIVAVTRRRRPAAAAH